MLELLIKEYYKPTKLKELWEILSYIGAKQYKIIGGGTDLVVKLKRVPSLEPVIVIDIKGIDEITNIVPLKSGGVSIGSGVTFSKIIESQLIKERSPILVEACKKIGSPQIRNMGTIGGNIVNASPAGDSIPPLMVMDAVVNIAFEGGERAVPLVDFFKGPGSTILNRGEIVKEIIIEESFGNWIYYFFKEGQREALTIAKASLAVVIKGEGGYIEDIRIAMGSVAPTVKRAYKTEEFLRGSFLNDNKVDEAIFIIESEISPIDDFRSTKEYRRFLIRQFLKEALYRFKYGAYA